MTKLVSRLAAAALLAALATPQAGPAFQAVDALALKDLEDRMVGPYRGGRSTAAAGFLSDPDKWIMGTTGGGMWQTNDNGVSWEPISDDAFGGSVGAVAVAASDENVIYAGTGSAQELACFSVVDMHASPLQAFQRRLIEPCDLPV